MSYVALYHSEKIHTADFSTQALRDLQDEDRQASTPSFFCHACQEPMTLKVGHRNVPHFAHRPGHPCPYEGKPASEEHRAYQVQLRDYVRDQLHLAKVEVEWPIAHHEGMTRRRIADIGVGGDVVPVVVCEIQLSPISLHELKRRTEDYLLAGVRAVLWFVPKNSEHYRYGEPTDPSHHESPHIYPLTCLERRESTTHHMRRWLGLIKCVTAYWRAQGVSAWDVLSERVFGDPGYADMFALHDDHEKLMDSPGLLLLDHLHQARLDRAHFKAQSEASGNRLAAVAQEYAALQKAHVQLKMQLRAALDDQHKLEKNAQKLTETIQELRSTRQVNLPRWTSIEEKWVTDVIDVHQKKEGSVQVSFVACAWFHRDEFQLSTDEQRLLVRTHVAHRRALCVPEQE